MNRFLRFLRSLDKRQLIFILQRASALLLPMRPYAACGQSKTCPCPMMRQQRIQDIAIGGTAARVEIKGSGA